MTDFSHYTKLTVSGQQTATYPFFDLEGEPSIASRPAAECNSPYFNALLKSSRRMARRVSRGQMSAAILKEGRETDYRLFSRYIAVKFVSPPLLADGTPADSDPETIEAFLRAVPTDMFDDYRAWAGDLSNFREDEIEEMDGDEVDDLSGN